MGIFNEFNKKEKPVFTGSRFGFGFGTSGLTVSSEFAASGGQITPGSATANGYTYLTFLTRQTLQKHFKLQMLAIM